MLALKNVELKNVVNPKGVIQPTPLEIWHTILVAIKF